METFTEPKAVEENPCFKAQRERSLAGLSDEMIDPPMVDIVRSFNRLPYGFTIQCCYGHFLYGDRDPHTLAPLPETASIKRVSYRIAYIAFCIDNTGAGKKFLEVLNRIPANFPGVVQFCSAEWFWERQINSYALQVEPERFKHKDRVVLNYAEALRVEKIRNGFMDHLKDMLRVSV